MKAHPAESHNDSMKNIQCIGIDFGTHKCAMFKFYPEKGEAKAIRNAEGEETTLSLVFYGEEEILVGTPAIDMLEDPELCKNVITDVKLHLADSIRYAVSRETEPTPVQVATEIFRKLKRDAEASGEFDGEITHAVVTYPVMFTQLEQDMLLRAVQDAGFHKVHLLKEPEAAAIAFVKEGHLPGNCILVYDLGAGTFDLAVLVRDAKTGFYRSTQLVDGMRRGGSNFDRMLYDYCDKLFKDQYGYSMSMGQGTELMYLNRCRKMKENLSKSQSAPFSLPALNRDKKVIYFKPPIDKTTFEGLIQDVVEETILRTQALFERAHSLNHDVDTIVLTGGSSQIPLVNRLLREALPVEPQPWHNRHLAVGLGAAYCAYDLWGIDYQIRQYRQEIEEFQGKGIWSEETNTHLANLREELALTDNQAEQIERDVLGLTVSETMQALIGHVDDEELQSKLDEFKMKAKAASRNAFTFLLVGRTGVGKSSSVNSLMDKEVAKVGHHVPTTVTVEFYHHEAAGINFTVVDTPGLCDDLEDKGNDESYLELIRTKVPEVDCLWYVTKLNDTRVSNDERRAIKLISAGCGRDIWKRAIIVFTYANAVHYSNTVPLLEQYSNACKERALLIRKEIARWTSYSVADEIPDEVPFVAIDNLTRTTPDGKEWLGKLYTAVFTRITDRGLLPFLLLIDDRVKFGPRTSENAKDGNSSRYTGTGTSSIYIEDEDSESLNKRLRRTMVDIFGESVVNNVSRAVSGAYNSVKSFLKGLFS